jgi:hypothetical protein
VFLILGVFLLLTIPFLLHRRSGAWTFAMLVTPIGMLWSFYSIAQVIAVFHVEWDTAAAMSAVLTGYLPTVRRFFRPIDLE